MEPKMIDHLFRHHYGKMVSVLTRIFGLAHLETIQDAVQDTFLKATISWKNKPPENPEAWLTKSAKNRVLDIFRKLNAERKRVPQITNGMDAMAINELFLDTEIEDSQLRMIFTACHPYLSPTERIAFSLKTISGFSSKEIASAVLTKEETIRKRLTRARKTIQTKDISFQIPVGKELPERMDSVLEVVYLIFNEGFHSNKSEILIRKELCGEAMRLCQMLLKNKITRTPQAYALFALMCFHASRLDSKMDKNGAVVDLKHQDRSLWHFPLIRMGNNAMLKAVEDDQYSPYHYEAAIATEHLKARSFETTNWDKIFMWCERLYEIQPSPIASLQMAVVQLQRNKLEEAKQLLWSIQPNELVQRAYLYYGFLAEYYRKNGEKNKAIESLDIAISKAGNQAEKKYLENKKISIQNKNSV
ncbi:MAG: sigma-70 family RNA polymerase sigma factor [Flavobacteriaceae bacterium]|nr:sigma-70 family RNA polymerase sigma factor [Flavobacteriaceae bacterium]